MLDNKFFIRFCRERNIKKSTINGYVSALTDYVQFQNMGLDELLDEAQSDEKLFIPLKERKLKKRLIGYRKYLLNKYDSPNTVKSYFTKIKTFYTHFEIEIPLLPSVKYNKPYETNYYDLPTKDHIRLAVNKSDALLRSIILFMSSSGTAKAETLSITVGMFIDGCRDYYDTSITDLQLILSELGKKKNIIPTLYLHRLKTDKYYYTFCSHEASAEIIKYLMTRQGLSLTDPLFDISPSTLLVRFQEINDSFGWGFKGKYRFFRSHALRKFHASNIGLGEEYVDALQGRSKDSVHSAYIKFNPVRLRELYLSVVDNVLIGEVGVESVSQEFTIVINVFLSGKEFNIF